MAVGALATTVTAVVPQVDLAAKQVPLQGDEGGPRRALDTADLARWLAGRELFSRTFSETEGRGPLFNAEKLWRVS